MKIVAATCYRFDKDYIEDYKKNLRDLVDDFVIIYDKTGQFIVDEGKMRQKLIQRAKKLGADYIVILDPDERLEKRASKIIKKLIHKYQGQKVMFKFKFCELYEPRRYRIDGIWNEKWRIPIFPLLDSNIYSDQTLHTPRQPLNDDYKIIETGLNIYHLKHIKPELRQLRKGLYNKLDPNHKFQNFGYDYLDDLTGIKLQRIPLGGGRMYQPRYRNYQVDKEAFNI